MKNNDVKVRDFVTDAYDYLSVLRDCSEKKTVNLYLLEYIANGFAIYGHSAKAFIDNVNDWIRMLVNVFPELKFDYDTNQVKATIDLVDQLVIIDDDLCQSLEYVINIQEKYGLIIKYKSNRLNIDKSTTLAHFFEYIDRLYPSIKDRYKGLGSSSAIVSKEVIMDPRTRRIMQVTMNDVDTMTKLGVLVGDGKDNKDARREKLLNFPFTMDMIDN